MQLHHQHRRPAVMRDSNFKQRHCLSSSPKPPHCRNPPVLRRSRCLFHTSSTPMTPESSHDFVSWQRVNSQIPCAPCMAECECDWVRERQTWSALGYREGVGKCYISALTIYSDRGEPLTWQWSWTTYKVLTNVVECKKDTKLLPDQSRKDPVTQICRCIVESN